MNTTMLMGLEENTVGPELEKAPPGIRGLDQITGGGLPRGRVSLVAGAAGAGKTLLGLEFVVGGARKYGEPGVLLSFEESAEKVALNVRSLGFDLNQLEQDGLLANARRFCEEELGGQVDLDIIDVQLEPALVVRDQIVAAPTLARHMPAPLRRLVGDLSDFGRVRQSLELGPRESIDEHATPGG